MRPFIQKMLVLLLVVFGYSSVLAQTATETETETLTSTETPTATRTATATPTPTFSSTATLTSSSTSTPTSTATTTFTFTFTPAPRKSISDKNISHGRVIVTSAGGTATVTLDPIYVLSPKPYDIQLTLDGVISNSNAVYTQPTTISSGSFVLTVYDNSGVSVNCSVTSQRVFWSVQRDD